MTYIQYFYGQCLGILWASASADGGRVGSALFFIVAHQAAFVKGYGKLFEKRKKGCFFAGGVLSFGYSKTKEEAYAFHTF